MKELRIFLMTHSSSKYFDFFIFFKFSKNLLQLWLLVFWLVLMNLSKFVVQFLSEVSYEHPIDVVP